MSVSRLLSVAIFAALVLSACSAKVSGQATTSPGNDAAVTTSTTPNNTPATTASVEPGGADFVIESCVLLSGDDVLKILDSDVVKQVNAKEKERKSRNRMVDTICEYHDASDDVLFARHTANFSQSDDIATQNLQIDNRVSSILNNKADHHDIEGVGDRAMFYREKDQANVISVFAAKIVEGKLFVATLSINAKYPEKVKPRMIDAMREVIEKPFVK